MFYQIYFAFLLFFCISHIMVKKLNFRFSIFLINQKNIHLILRNVPIQICRSLCSKEFCIITFFHISYNLIGKWNLDIEIFQVLTY